MPTGPETKTQAQSIPKIVVAGDVCIDWLSIPIESLVPEPDSTQPMNWQLRGGRHMYARRGGSWLTEDFLEAAVGNSAMVLKPAKEKLPLENVPPDKIIHSMLTLGRSDRVREKEKVSYWVVNQFEGYAGPPYPNKPEVKPVENDDRDAQIVLLDDAGNGFRDEKEAWPLAINKECTPLVLYKVRRPLAMGPLWEHLKAFHLDRTMALLSADELRGEGGCISRGLSWEQSATDLVLALAHEPRFMPLLGCPFLIIPFALEAVVLVRCENNQVKSARLWYRPNLTEGESTRSGLGQMSGFGSAFAASVAAALIKSPDGLWDMRKIDQVLRAGIDNGFEAMRNLLEEAFGPCTVKDPANPEGVIRPPKYPMKIFPKPNEAPPPVISVDLPTPPSERKKIAEFRSWRILDSKRQKVFVDLAADVVRRGVEKVFADVPSGRFGKFVTLDRKEIESYRSIQNLIKEFLDNPNPARPLCLGVFGPPGGGKSFGVAEVARSLDKGGRIAKLDFNVSQWTSTDHLVSALHRVRDYSLLGKVPLVFFDEFDTPSGGQPLGWLKYFLAPMQDGVFADGPFTHEIGKAIFAFAGGTVDKFEQLWAKTGTAHAETETRNPTTASQSQPVGNPSFGSAQASAAIEQPASEDTSKSLASQSAKDRNAQNHASQASPQGEEIRGVKLLDFVSRLRGHVDVFGIDGPVDTNLLRRALILRSNIEKKFSTLIDASGAVRIDEGVLRAFLQVPRYYHGARSLEAILDMSHLVGRRHFDPSLLPPLHQLNLHVKGDDFMALIEHQQVLGAKLEEIAKEIHELYLKEELAKKDDDGKQLYQIGERPSLYHWEALSDFYKNSSREQAANYPTLLAAVGCSFEETEKGHRVNHDALKSDANTVVEFSDEEVEKLARMEHERWMQERRIKQPDHPDLKEWEELPEEEKEKDRRTIRAISEILGKVGLRLVRLL